MPPGTLEQDDHDLMETIFGKKIMKEVDKVVDERSKQDDNDGNMG